MALDAAQLIMLQTEQKNYEMAQKGMFGVSSGTVAERALAAINNLMNVAAGKPASTYVGQDSVYDKAIRYEQMQRPVSYDYTAQKQTVVQSAAQQVGEQIAPFKEQPMFGSFNLNDDKIMQYVIIYLGVLVFTTFLKMFGGGRK